MVDRALAAGYRRSHRRRPGQRAAPPGPAERLRHPVLPHPRAVLDGLTHPAWSSRFVRSGMPQLANFARLARQTGHGPGQHARRGVRRTADGIRGNARTDAAPPSPGYADHGDLGHRHRTVGRGSTGGGPAPARLLGGDVRPVRAYASLRSMSPQAVAAEAAELAPRAPTRSRQRSGPGRSPTTAGRSPRCGTPSARRHRGGLQPGAHRAGGDPQDPGARRRAPAPAGYCSPTG